VRPQQSPAGNREEHIMRALAFLAALSALVGGAPAQAAYPERPVTLIVPFAPGGPTDIIARIVSEHWSRSLGQQFVIENVTGAGGTVGVTRVMRSPPDGYTLLLGNLGTQAASVGLYPNLAYDPRSDFAFIIMAASTPLLVAAKKDLPVKDFREFVAYVKANDGKLNYGTGGVGAASHLACLYLDHLLGTKVTHVPYRGSGPALQALIAGQIDYVCDQTVGIVPSIQGGLVKGLAIASTERTAVLPNLPTSVEQGLPKFQVTGWNVFLAPKGTPSAIVDQLNAAGRAALKDDIVRKRLLELGADLPPEAEQTRTSAAELVRAEVEKWVPVIKAAGVTAN
jgi:tripartite-type tricarboxylate transporter receptor subunit TctC